MKRLAFVPAAVAAVVMGGSMVAMPSASAASPYPACKPGQSAAFSPLHVSPHVVHAGPAVFPTISQYITPCRSRTFKIRVTPNVTMPKTCKPKYQPYGDVPMTLRPNEGSSYDIGAVQLAGPICQGRYTVRVRITSNGRVLSNAAGSFFVVK